jgi:calcineurin-like phosphoesterase family protein
VCKNIHLILGNHDHHIERNKENIQSIFSSVNQYLSLDVKWSIKKNEFEHARFVLMHYPIASWNGMNDGVIHLHGHVHLLPQHRIAQGKAMDVGVDGNKYEPINMKEILKIMEKQPIDKLSLPRDHHVKRVV